MQFSSTVYLKNQCVRVYFLVKIPIFQDTHEPIAVQVYTNFRMKTDPRVVNLYDVSCTILYAIDYKWLPMANATA